MYMHGGFPAGDYHFLQGFGSYNSMWVSGYQDPFNKNYLVPAVALGQTNPAGAYAMLAPAYAKIRADAVAFVNKAPDKAAAQQTIDGWAKDWPLIESNLNNWAAAAPSAVVAAPAASAQPTTIFQDSAPTVYGGGSAPAIYGPAQPSQVVPYNPAAPASVNVTTGPGTDLSSMLTEYLPWIAGAAVVGLLLTSGGSRRHGG
jgi:hypothetical protein